MSLISTDFAEKNLKEFKIIDASWHLPTENRDPYLEYKESHIPNSVFFDLDNTSEKNTDLPHMLPSEDQWSKSISKLGISNNDKILIYDKTSVLQLQTERFDTVINIEKVHQIITNLCVFNVKQDGLEIIEYADDVDRKQIEEATEAKILN